MVQDKPVESIKVHTVSCDVGCWGIGEIGWGDVGVENVWAWVNVGEVTAICDVTDQQWVDLSDCSNRDGNSNSCYIDLLVNDFNFKRRVTSKNFSRTDFKPLNESQGLDGSLEIWPERQQNGNILPRNTSTQRPSINLIIPSLNVILILGKEGKGNLSPRSIFPLSSDNKRNNTITVRSNWLDGEKLICAILTLKVIDGWIN